MVKGSNIITKRNYISTPNPFNYSFGNDSHEETSSFNTRDEKKKSNRIKLNEEGIGKSKTTKRRSLKIYIEENYSSVKDITTVTLLQQISQVAIIFDPIFDQLDRKNYHKALFLLEKNKDMFLFNNFSSIEERNEEIEKYVVLSVAKICDILLCHFEQTKEYLKVQKVLSFLKDYTKDKSWNKTSICDPITQKGISFLVRMTIQSMKEEFGKRFYEAVNNKNENIQSFPSLQLLLDIFKQGDFSTDSGMRQCLSFVIGMSNSHYYIMDIYSLDIILELLIEGKKFDTAYALVKKESERLILPVITKLTNDSNQSYYYNNVHIYELAHKVLTIFGECKYYDQIYELYRLIKRPSQKCFNLTIFYLAVSNSPEHLRIIIELIQETINNRGNYVHIISPINVRDLFRSESMAAKLFTFEQVSILFDILFNKLNIKYSTRILNIFLNLQLKHGKEQEAMQTLQKFEEHGVQVNISTLSSILTYFCNNSKFEDGIRICDKIIEEPLIFDIPFLNIVWKIYYEYGWKVMIKTTKTITIGTNNYTVSNTNIELLESIKSFERNELACFIEWKKNLHDNPLFSIHETKRNEIDSQTKIFEYLLIQMERAFDRYILTSYNVMSKNNGENTRTKQGKVDWYIPQTSARHLRYGTKAMDENSYLHSTDASIPHFLQNKQSKLIASDGCRLDLRVLIQNYAIRPRLRQIDDLLEFISGAYSRNNSLRRYYYLRVIISLLECGNISHVKPYVKAQFENCEMPLTERINTMHHIVKTIQSKFNPTLKQQYCTEWKSDSIDSLTKMMDMLSIEEWNQVMNQSGVIIKFEDYEDLNEWIRMKLLVNHQATTPLQQ